VLWIKASRLACLANTLLLLLLLLLLPPFALRGLLPQLANLASKRLS
jgi:hypothetical protein